MTRPEEASAPGDFVVRATGMVAASGFCAAACCAAARAGVSRAKEIGYFHLKPSPDGAPEPAIGHGVQTVTPGFEGYGRLQALARLALEDLRTGSAPASGSVRRLGTFLALPSAHRTATGLELLPAEDSGEDRNANVERAEEEVNDHGARLIELVLDTMRIASSPLVTFVDERGTHCGVARAVGQACTYLRDGRIDHAIVGGVDSLLDEGTLQWLLDTGRLKHSGLASGLQPGEAAAFLWLSRRSAAPVQVGQGAILVAVGYGLEPGTLISGGTSTGRGMLDAVCGTRIHEMPSDVWTITDHNGERYRAHDWGCALMRFAAADSRLEAAPIWYPAIAFGDVGAASGATALVWAVESFIRCYAPARYCLICSADDGDQRTAMLLASPGTGDRS